jgi:hypothetical protein
MVKVKKRLGRTKLNKDEHRPTKKRTRKITEEEREAFQEDIFAACFQR